MLLSLLYLDILLVMERRLKDKYTEGIILPKMRTQYIQIIATIAPQS